MKNESRKSGVCVNAAALKVRAAALRIIKFLFMCERRDTHSSSFEGHNATYRKINLNIKAAALGTVKLRAAALI